MPVDAPSLLKGLPPIIDERSRLLILGSFPSRMSLEKSEYYGNPQNGFWPIMERLFAIDRRLPYEERVHRLLRQGIAVWDVIAVCRREGSSDQAIKDARPNPIVDLLARHRRIQHVVFNGIAAWQTARREAPELFRSVTVSMERFPSTSPKHATRSLEQKVAVWARLRTMLEEAG